MSETKHNIHVHFSKEEDSKLLDLFRSDEYGINEDKFEVVNSREVALFSIEDAKEKAKEFKFVSQGNQAVINLLKAGVPLETIRKSLDLTTEGLNTILEELKRQGLVDANNKVTDKGFCLEMVGISSFKSFTIEDIETISAFEGRDVFRFRGGWYTNPVTEVTTPYCRHIWQQRLVRLKD